MIVFVLFFVVIMAVGSYGDKLMENSKKKEVEIKEKALLIFKNNARAIHEHISNRVLNIQPANPLFGVEQLVSECMNIVVNKEKPDLRGKDVNDYPPEYQKVFDMIDAYTSNLFEKLAALDHMPRNYHLFEESL